MSREYPPKPRSIREDRSAKIGCWRIRWNQPAQRPASWPSWREQKPQYIYARAPSHLYAVAQGFDVLERVSRELSHVHTELDGFRYSRSVRCQVPSIKNAAILTSLGGTTAEKSHAPRSIWMFRNTLCLCRPAANPTFQSWELYMRSGYEKV